MSTELLTDLRDRLVSADKMLVQAASLSDKHGHPESAARLHGKAQGVRLALSYLDEYLRRAAPPSGDIPPPRRPLSPGHERW